MTAETCKEILLEQLNQQLGFFRELCCISREQLRITLLDEAQQLLSLNADRSSVLRRLEVLDAASAEYRSYWQEHEGNFSAEASVEIREKFVEVARQLRELLCADEELKESVQEKMVETRNRIGATKQGRRVISAYARPTPGAHPRYVSRLST